MSHDLIEICDRPVELRPRERLRSTGAAALSDRDLIAVLLGSGMRGRSVLHLAEDILAVVDSRGGRVTAQDLVQISGLGPAKAAVIAGAIELGRRVLCPGRHRIGYPRDIMPLIDRFADRKQEYFLCVSLNGAHEVIACRVVSIGLVNRTMVHPREVFADPLVDRAAAVIVAHNHPSGNVEPSAEDTAVTKQLADAGRMLAIPMLDHIVFAGGAFYSFLEHDAL